MMGDREATTRTAKTPRRRIPTTLPDIEAPVLFDREGTSLAIVEGVVAGRVKVALTLSADPS
jgi:hypothetical protein